MDEKKWLALLEIIRLRESGKRSGWLYNKRLIELEKQYPTANLESDIKQYTDLQESLVHIVRLFEEILKTQANSKESKSGIIDGAITGAITGVRNAYQSTHDFLGAVPKIGDKLQQVADLAALGAQTMKSGIKYGAKYVFRNPKEELISLLSKIGSSVEKVAEIYDTYKLGKFAIYANTIQNYAEETSSQIVQDFVLRIKAEFKAKLDDYKKAIIALAFSKTDAEKNVHCYELKELLEDHFFEVTERGLPAHPREDMYTGASTTDIEQIKQFTEQVQTNYENIKTLMQDCFTVKSYVTKTTRSY